MLNFLVGTTKQICIYQKVKESENTAKVFSQEGHLEAP